MEQFVLILSATMAVSLISLAGIFFVGMKDERMEDFLEHLVAFAAGGLLGGAFFHLLPESLTDANPSGIQHVLFGIIVFFVIEKLFHWRHCHQDHCEVHTFTYLNLIGDGIHNFIDGMIIAAAFVSDPRLGLVTTLAVAAHEIPQEIGDFAVLVYGGFSRTRALVYNLLTALTAVIGAVIAYVTFGQVLWLRAFLIPFTAGGFIYIALVDLIPELHRRTKGGKLMVQMTFLALGLVIMWGLRLLFGE